MPVVGARKTKSVLLIVQETQAIRSWIDGRIEAGWTDEEIEEVLPSAVAFITGRITEADLLRIATRT